MLAGVGRKKKTPRCLPTKTGANHKTARYGMKYVERPLENAGKWKHVYGFTSYSVLLRLYSFRVAQGLGLNFSDSKGPERGAKSLRTLVSTSERLPM